MKNITLSIHKVTRDERHQRFGQKGGVVWLTGLSGSGKTTIAIELERRLHDAGASVFALDGDNLRHGLNADLEFTPDDREENIRRVGEVAALMSRAGLIVIAAFISPYNAHRQRARKAADDAFHEVWIKADLKTCERRDPKGLYKKARSGEILDFTGVSAPYEEPQAPDIIVDTVLHDVDECVEKLMRYVKRHLINTVES